MKVYLGEDEWYPVPYYRKPTEFDGEDTLVEVPDELLQEFDRVDAEFWDVAQKLNEYMK